jgi:hypothetical protein
VRGAWVIGELARVVMMRSVLTSFVITVAGCTTVGNAPVDNPAERLDRDRFACVVEPILARDCSYTGCHGNEQFPLRVYSVGKLRAGSMDTLDDRLVTLTDDERRANFESAAAFAFGGVAPDDNLLVRKALPVQSGGYAHLGGAIFTGRSDARAVAIHDWLDGGAGCPGGTP